MNIPYDRRTDVFTDWLDAEVMGKSTPDHELAADPELAEICAAADQFHGLNQRLGQYTSFVSPTSSSWEDIMATNSLVPVSASFLAPSKEENAPTKWAGGPARQRFDRFVTGALAAALVVAIGGGAWISSDGNLFGGDNQPPATIGFGGLGPESEDSNRLVPEVTVSPDDEMSSIPYPSATECTVELPTREWVETHIHDTIDTTGATAFERYEWPIEPTQDDIDEVMSTFRLWQACGLVGNARAQAFTLETPWWTKSQGNIWGMAEQPVSKSELNFLVDIAMTGSEKEMNQIANAYYEGTPGAPVIGYATPGATPSTKEELATSREQREYAPYPEGATLVATPTSNLSAWPTIFADGIQMIGPDQAQAQIYVVSPETGEVMIGSGGAGYVVQLIRVDGFWLIDFYGEPERG